MRRFIYRWLYRLHLRKRPSYHDSILSLDPVGYWPLNETEGPHAHDISGLGLDGSFFSFRDMPPGWRIENGVWHYDVMVDGKHYVDGERVRGCIHHDRVLTREEFGRMYLDDRDLCDHPECVCHGR